MPLTLFLALAALSEPPAASAPALEPVPPVRARTHQPNLFSDRDYPASARRLGQRGRVTYEIRVAPNGRIDRCRILVSSRVPVLDQTTRRLLQERARFSPARDAGGKPTFDTLTGSMNWRL
jgi:TonB family protein